MGDEFADYIRQQAIDTDVFCFQEAYDKMKLICAEVFSNYEMISAFKSVTENDEFPQATYVRKGIKIVSTEVIMQDEPGTGLAIYIQLEAEGSMVHICNFHGISRPIEKLDNPGRLLQSQTLIDFFKGKQGQLIIGGDFNILPETESIKMFEKNGYKDLIKDFNIKTTK